jgi:hypothetical protein
LPVKARELDLILRAHEEFFPEAIGQRKYLFLDEVQNVPGWDLHPWEFDPGQLVLLTGQQSGAGSVGAVSRLPALMPTRLAQSLVIDAMSAPSRRRAMAMKNTSRSPSFLRILSLILAGSVAHATPYVFTTVNPTSDAGTSSGTFVSQVLGLNDNGQVVVSTPQGGFIYQSGSYTPLPLGPAGYTLGPEGINDTGTIVGTAVDASGNTQGFILQNRSYSLFSVPGNTGYMEARAVSPTGIVSGIFTDSVGNQEGYTYDPSTDTFTDINPPGSILTFAQGMNRAGQLAGSGLSIGGGHFGFIYQNGAYSTFKISGELLTAARAINDAGVITGYVQYDPSPGNAFLQAFVGTPSSGFQLLGDPAAGTAATIGSSGLAGTFGEAINDSGQLGGEYIDPSGNTFGFIATPVTLPSGTAANGAFTFDASVAADSLIYIDPALASGYRYETGSGDPSFQSVVLPIGIGDNLYSLSLCNGTSLGTLAGGATYNFGAGGTDCFDVTGIPASADLSASDSQAFATGLTFTGAGTFTGTMTPFISSVPEPSALWLFAAGLALASKTAGRSRLRRLARGIKPPTLHRACV